MTCLWNEKWKCSSTEKRIQRMAAERLLKCGRTQIQSIVRNKEKILSQYEANVPSSRRRYRPGEFEDVNQAMYTWYSLARQRSVPVSGPMLAL